MYRFFFACFVSLAPAFYGLPAKAGPVQDAIAAANSRDYEGAVSILRRAAVAGDGDAPPLEQAVTQQRMA